MKPDLTLLYTPMRPAIKRHPVLPLSSPAGSSTSRAQKVLKCLWTEMMVLRIMVTLGTFGDRGVEKEDLGG